MRLRNVEKGDGLIYNILIRFISIISGMRLPDAARIVMYHQDFYGRPMTSWTHAAMRGKSNWSVGERELIAAMVAKWNTCPFCIDAHGSIAALELGNSTVQSVLEDLEGSNMSTKLRMTLVFLEKLTKSPDKLSIEDAGTVLGYAIPLEDLEDAVAVAALFSITVRCANAFNFDLLDSRDSARAAKRMLKQGYVFGKGGVQGRPDHRSFAEALRKRVFEDSGLTDVSLRQAIAARTTGGAPIEAPYDVFALQIGEGAHKITDELINEMILRTGSEKATFELITTAAVSAGLFRWDKAISLLKEAS